MARALFLQRTDDNAFRAIIFLKEEDGFKTVDDIAEAQELTDLALWFAENGQDVEAVCGNYSQEWDYPDCLTVWEAAEAAMV